MGQAGHEDPVKYRPGSDQMNGSLRLGGSKAVGKDLDSAIIELIEHEARNPYTMIGDDFNLDLISVAIMLLKSGMRNALCEMDEDVPTFRRLVNGKVQESMIDHVAWTGASRNGSYAIGGGDFTADHISAGWLGGYLGQTKHCTANWL